MMMFRKKNGLSSSCCCCWRGGTTIQLLVLVAVAALTIRSTHAETVLLAECPKEPDVQGTFRNNGEYCVRDRQVLSRDVIPATCPEAVDDAADGEDEDPPPPSAYELKGGKCKRRHPRRKQQSVNPICPSGYQRFGDKCHKKCPNKEHRSKYKECILPRKVLGPKYMTCPARTSLTDDNDDDTEAMVQYHRYDAYCCIPGVNCPQLQCNLGQQVPGKFFYTDEGKCERQVETVARAITPRPRGETNTNGNGSGSGNGRPGDCPEGLQQVWGACQEPCPYGFRPLKGKCELGPCVFDPMTETVVECPEATYKVAQSIF